MENQPQLPLPQPVANKLLEVIENTESDADFLSLFWNSNVDVDQRRVFLFGEINQQSVLNCIKGLSLIDRLEGPIELWICSEGGDVVSGSALIDYLFTMKNKIYGLVIGEASSMASLILQACTVRAMTPRSIILIHSGSAGVEGSPSSIRAHADYLKKDQETSIALYRMRTGMSVKKLKQWLSKDTIFDAKTALKFGFIDEIKQSTYISKKE